VDDDLAVLRGILARRGFGAAASYLQARDVRNIRETILAWERYPEIMDQYPTHLQANRREIERALTGRGRRLYS